MLAGRTRDTPDTDRAPVMRFLGGAGTVTGSRFLITTARARILVDCGLFQGLKELRLRNWEPFPVPPASIDAVVVTHAHVDHCGYLPALTRDGFRGRILATADTRALCEIVLRDSAHVQEEDAAYANRRGYSKHTPALPLYTARDAEQALTRFATVAFGAEAEIAPGVAIAFHPAGHILGSAIATVDLRDAGRRVVFSGDLGRAHHPVLVPPAPVPATDIVVVEATYGDRQHDDAAALERFEAALGRTVERGGVVVIPAFAVDRTEVVLHRIHALARTGRIPDVPVYVDSPLALAALDIYRRALARGAEDVRRPTPGDGDPFDPGRIIAARSTKDSIAINDEQGPAIIVSASGMATGGRVLHHLARRLPDERNTVILAGYQAEGTRGRRLAEGARELKLLGRYVPVRAEIVSVGAFSVHADQSELLAWLRTAARPPETTFVVHGEPVAAVTLHDRIEADLGWTAAVPRHLEQVRLD